MNSGKSGRIISVALALLLGTAMLLQVVPRSWIESKDGSVATIEAATGNETILRVGFLQNPDSLNPFTELEDASYYLSSLIYDWIVGYDQDWHPKPLIATDWQDADWPDADNASGIASGAHRLWIYHIAQGIHWQDGQPLTSEDVAYSINVNLNSSMWAYTPYINTGIAEYARAINATTVYVYLKIPDVHPDTLHIPVVPEHIWGQYNVTEILTSVVNEHPIGSGPFKFVEFVKNQHVLLERNPDYFLGPVAYDKIVINIYGSDQVMAEDLKNGNIDIGRFPPSTFDSLKGRPNVETGVLKRYYQVTIGFNCNTDNTTNNGNPLMLDVNIRRAMELAINKTYLIKTIWRGYGDIGYALPPPVVPFYHWEPQNDTESLNYDLSRANDLLDASGYDNWSNGVRMVNTTDNPYAQLGTPLSFTFDIPMNAGEEMAAAPYIAEMWRAIGIDVKIEPLDEGTMETKIYYDCAHQVYMWYWSGDADPTYILGVMTTAQIWGWNDPFWSNDTYDSLYYVQLQQNGTARQQTVFDMEKIWYESAPMMVITYPYALYAWSTLHFTNWSDPVAHPASMYENYFGASPLYMSLQPVTGKVSHGPSTTTIIAGAVAAVLIIAAVAAVLMLRRRKVAGPKEGAPEEEKKTGLE